uniref:Uncharacterized protein n=1 Tax=Urocitellus parryii TaxID=9999 RepID=A0A8D2HRU5_UROPR
IEKSSPEQTSLVEEGQPQTCKEAASGIEPDTTATTSPSSFKEKELEFQPLTTQLEVERQIVVSHLERCRLAAKSPSMLPPAQLSHFLGDQQMCHILSISKQILSCRLCSPQQLSHQDRAITRDPLFTRTDFSP